METLFITPKYLTENTHLDGNTDFVNYNFHIAEVQIDVIEKMLGTELYDKILEDFINDSLAGLYLDIFEKYVKPVTKYMAVSEYIKTPYTVGKGGVYKNRGENRENLSPEELENFSARYTSRGQSFIGRFEKFIELNKDNIPEYKTNQDEVDAGNQTKIMDIMFLDNNSQCH